jgi:hypothetical protein
MDDITPLGGIVVGHMTTIICIWDREPVFTISYHLYLQQGTSCYCTSAIFYIYWMGVIALSNSMLCDKQMYLIRPRTIRIGVQLTRNRAHLLPRKWNLLCWRFKRWYSQIRTLWCTPNVINLIVSKRAQIKSVLPHAIIRPINSMVAVQLRKEQIGDWMNLDTGCVDVYVIYIAFFRCSNRTVIATLFKWNLLQYVIQPTVANYRTEVICWFNIA